MDYEDKNREISVYVQELGCWVRFENIKELRNFVNGYMKLSRANESKGIKVEPKSVKYIEYGPGKWNLVIIMLTCFNERKYWQDARRELEAEKARLMEVSA